MHARTSKWNIGSAGTTAHIAGCVVQGYIPNYRGKEIIGYIGSGTDITDRKNNEEELLKKFESRESHQPRQR